MVALNDLDGFEWDDGNRVKNWIAHQVTIGECEEVFFNLPLLLLSDPTHSQAEVRNYALGQTNNGRRLFVVFTTRNNKIGVVFARDMSKKERMIYAKETP